MTPVGVLNGLHWSLVFVIVSACSFFIFYIFIEALSFSDLSGKINIPALLLPTLITINGSI